MKRFFPALILPAALAACSGGSERAERNAELLEGAAEQSTDAAADVLENAAGEVRDQEVALPPADPQSSVQDAMRAAGDAQARALPEPEATPDASVQEPPSERR